MRIHLSHDLKPRTNLDGTTGKNFANGLVKPVQELAKSVTETSSKMQEPKTYDEAINNTIHRNK